HSGTDLARRAKERGKEMPKLPGLPGKIDPGMFGGPDSTMRVSSDDHSDLWPLTDDLPVPNDIPRSRSMQYVVPRPKWHQKEATPGLTPAPASQVTKVPPLWSRPVAPWVKGMRPNSVVQMTSVSSKRPRAFRSRSRAAIGLSTLEAMNGSSL